MSKYLIRGQKKLSGNIQVGGAKNASLPLLCATLLAPGEYLFSNVPDLKDVEVLINLLRHLGLKIEKNGQNFYRIINEGIKTVEAPYELVKPMRASFLVMGPLLGSEKRAKVSLPGGCAIGARPVNFHLNGFENLGAKITIDHGFVVAETRELNGSTIELPFPTVTGTENLMMAAVKANGRTIIKNAAREPEIVDLGDLLNKMGALITGLGTEEIQIEGVSDLHSTNHTVIPDRIEAGTFLVLSALSGGEVIVQGVRKDHLQVFLEKLETAGFFCESIAGGLRLVKKNSENYSVHINTEPYPGFPTDVQPQTVVLLTQVMGQHILTENIFENRFMYIQELNRLGAEIGLQEKTAIISGSKKLIGAEVTATDLRAGAALVLAGLVAENTTIINEIEHIERGYEDLVGRLRSLGADIEKIM